MREAQAGSGTLAGAVEASADTVASHHGLLLLFITIWGGNFVLAEVALRELAPVSFSVARFLMGALAMLVIHYVQHRHRARHSRATGRLLPAIARGDWPRLLIVAVFGAMLAPWLGIEGLGLTHAGRAALWLALHAWTWVAILVGGTVGVGIGQWIQVRALRSSAPRVWCSITTWCRWRRSCRPG